MKRSENPTAGVGEGRAASGFPAVNPTYDADRDALYSRPMDDGRAPTDPDAEALLPPAFRGWFAAQGWAPHVHQLKMLEAARDGATALLIAPTGGGKTLAGFLPSLVELAERPREGLHTLYVSPLKALAVDIHRNLELPLSRGMRRADPATRPAPGRHPGRQRRERQEEAYRRRILMTHAGNATAHVACPNADAGRNLRRACPLRHPSTSCTALAGTSASEHCWSWPAPA